MAVIDWKDPEQAKAYRREKARQMRADPEFMNKVRKNKRELYAPRYRFKIIEKKYGITEDQYNEIWIEQCGRCAICKKHEQELGKVLYIDHCHSTGKVRGLLCQKCNTGIGLLFDDKEILLNAIKYLEKI